MNKEVRHFLNDHLSALEFQYDPINKGGSDRNFYRVRLPDGQTFIFMQYGTEVDENAYWAGINRFLTDLSIPAPRIIAYDHKQHFLLIEDLGDTDLYSLRTQPWHRRRTYYLKALSEIHRLHRYPLSDLPPAMKLANGYDRALYTEEHHYFRENFIEAVCRLQLSDAQVREWTSELSALIDRLLSVPASLIHRDFQSQNIMIKNDRPVFIDFQGMRQGNFFYDLGSLICDPYVAFTQTERNELIAFYYRILQPDYSLDQFTGHFWEASAQRLMQALGAYGFLGLKKNKTDFLTHTESGVRNLITATTLSDQLPALNEIARTCLDMLLHQKNHA
ncbi:MAG TPA: phosphotransferase [Smithellaceae bacterium]|nr:phosphotransferase [Smithellaceae bacterium]